MYTKGNFIDGTRGWKAVNCGNHWNNKAITNWQIQYSDDGECISDHVYSEADAKLISAAPEMAEALMRVEAYLEANKDILAPFPTRSELDNIRAALVKTGLY
jgi:hypothetical protein